ncbi:GGDEF domain-containing protein [Palleronia sediminis]|uniref:GGDEF domain-containing protein n=1 Tax=Palleronia sediminis TaxID=2547833 RepID=A0A4R6ABI1_9RHOB|nr:GGDEF domain-containing protein [Palleronia sediminis]TDL79678.1 GGDEF domain-containing protein [Palleronia sediminis]
MTVLDRAARDTLMPMHVLADPDGRILSTGPTLARIAGEMQLAGRDLLSVLPVSRPAGIVSAADLRAASGRLLWLRLGLGGPELRGVVVETGEGGMLLDLALSLPALSGIDALGLSADDFAPTDRTPDTLYLLEAKSLLSSEAARLIARIEDARVTAEAQAGTDPLTSLRNRRGLDAVLARLREGAAPFAVTMLDLDGFKAVNDRLGHAAGDALLVETASRLLGVTRGDDIVARTGGDEFVVVFPDLAARDTLADIAARIIAALELPVVLGDDRARISASLGTALSTDYVLPDPARMIADADRALYAAKEGGRARHVFHTPRHGRSARKPVEGPDG